MRYRACVYACVLLFQIFALTATSSSDHEQLVREGFSRRANEVSPGLYHHSFEHVTEEGVTTSIAYVARKVKHLVHLGDIDEVGLVSLKCARGVSGEAEIVEVTVANRSAPLLWQVASFSSNATILVGNEDVKCNDEQQTPIMHRVVEAPRLVTEDNDAGVYSFRLRATTTHFSHAFEHLHLKYYRGKRDLNAAKQELVAKIPLLNTEDDADDHDPLPTEEYPMSRKLGAFNVDDDARKQAVASPSPDEMPTFEFLTLLHRGNVTEASIARAGHRRLMSASTFSCDHDGLCGYGEYRSGWDYGDSCCCDNWGTCNWWGCGTEYRPSCASCSADKACATCSSCSMCTGSHSCDSCVYGSSRPYKVYKVWGYECEVCQYDGDCPTGYVCKGGLGRRSCEQGAALACAADMPLRSDRTSSGSKHVVRLKTVTVKEHDSGLGDSEGSHEYYAQTKYASGWDDKMDLPCLTHTSVDSPLDVSTEIAEVSCGESFRFGIWEDDSFFDDAMGDRWFSTLDFSTSSTIFYNSDSSKLSFVLECEGCNTECDSENSLLETFSASPANDVSYANDWSSSIDPYLPVGVWNYDANAGRATESYPLTSTGVKIECSDCHLTVSDADLYVEVTLDAVSGFKDFAILADSEVTFHIKALLEGSERESERWVKPLLDPFTLPYPLSIPGSVNFGVGQVGFTIGLKVRVDLTAELSTTVDGQATYTSDVVGKLKTGLVYAAETGSRFIGASSISNENVNWENSIEGALAAKLSVRPCIQGGIWGSALSLADAHAYGEICADVFAKTTLSHNSQGYETSPASDSPMTTALVHLDDVFPSVFKTCDVTSTTHDTQLLVEVGVGNPILSADLHAAINWDGSSTASSDNRDHDDGQLRENKYGPWTLAGLERSFPVASGCLCVSACSSTSPGDDTTGDTTGDDTTGDDTTGDDTTGDDTTGDDTTGDDTTELPETPSIPSADVNMPNEGIFVEGTLSLGGLRLYEWNTAAELAFRKTVAYSAQVSVEHVRVDSVSERNLAVSGRRLLNSVTLDVTYVVYSSSQARAEQISSAISSTVQSGSFSVAARSYGLTTVSSVTVTAAPAVVTISQSSDGRRRVSWFGIALCGALCAVYL